MLHQNIVIFTLIFCFQVIFWFWQDNILRNCFRFIFLKIIRYIRLFNDYFSFVFMFSSQMSMIVCLLLLILGPQIQGLRDESCGLGLLAKVWGSRELETQFLLNKMRLLHDIITFTTCLSSFPVMSLNHGLFSPSF